MNDTRRKTILICDDEKNRERSWKEALESVPRIDAVFDINILPPDELLEASMTLERRRREARKQPRDDFPGDEAEIIDKADILIVDYDLLELEGDYYQTGEGLAYLARCYSGCGLIVALNQFEQGVTFDLSLQSNGFPNSFADLNISSDLLRSSGLWSEPWEGFRPWFWPLLPNALEKFNSRCHALEGNMKQRILEFLRFPKEAISLIPNDLLEWIGGAEVTFEEFVNASDGGLHLKDQPLTTSSLVHIAAARVWQWLEWGILPAQNLLIDAPHLVSSFPSLIRDQAKDITTWNGTTSFVNHESLPLNNDVIESSRFAQIDWLSRPVWFWSQVKDNSNIKDVADPWSSEWPDHIFCEDTSRFLAEQQARSFVSAVNSPFVRRYVEFLEGKVDYKNKVRFAL